VAALRVSGKRMKCFGPLFDTVRSRPLPLHGVVPQVFSSVLAKLHPVLLLLPPSNCFHDALHDHAPPSEGPSRAVGLRWRTPGNAKYELINCNAVDIVTVDIIMIRDSSACRQSAPNRYAVAVVPAPGRRRARCDWWRRQRWAGTRQKEGAEHNARPSPCSRRC
jgi:hypothetical protein